MAFRKQRMGRRKVCYFTKNNIKYIDYKDVELLKSSSALMVRLHQDVLLELVRSIRKLAVAIKRTSDGSASIYC